MIRIHALALLAVLELAVVFLGLWMVWLFKARKLARRVDALRARPAVTHDESNAAAYFTEELLATQAQLEARADVDAQASAPLALRTAYLDVERELAQGQERNADFWAHARERIGLIIERFAPPAPVAPEEALESVPADPAAAGDGQRVKTLIEAQVSTINELKDALSALGADHEHAPAMLDQIDKLGRTNRELAMCVSILEDDNGFLRDKLKEAGISTE